jgi:hypothetical protein
LKNHSGPPPHPPIKWLKVPVTSCHLRLDTASITVAIYFATTLSRWMMRIKNKSMEHWKKVILIEILRIPVGGTLGPSDTIDASLYDTILRGLGPSTLYTAALLSRSGRKVLDCRSRMMPMGAPSYWIESANKIQGRTSPTTNSSCTCTLCSSDDYQEEGMLSKQMGMHLKSCRLILRPIVSIAHF